MDIRTLALAVGIAGIAESLILAIQSRIDRIHSGPGWWALGMASITVAYLAALGLSPSSSSSALAAVSIALRATGFALVLVGILRFAGARERRLALAGACIAAVLLQLAFDLAGERYRGYQAMGSLVSAVGAAASAWVLVRPRTRAYRSSAVVAATGFALLAAFFAIRLPLVLLSGAVEDPFAATPLNAASWLARLLGLLIATFGLVLMSNERLTGDLLASRERLDQAERAEMVGRLAGGVAHNFNNLLQVITGHVDLLEGELPPGDTRREDTRAIAAAAGRAADLTRQLLEVGRAVPARPVSVDVDAMLAALAPLLDERAGEGTAVTIRPGAPGGTVRVDPARLRDTVLALALRAKEHARAGEPIAVGSSFVEVGRDDARRPATARPGRFIRVSVSDPGETIGADRLAHVFEPFYSTDAGGWGPELGLSGAEATVVGAGGFMTATADPGGGITFAAFLPLEGDGRLA